MPGYDLPEPGEANWADKLVNSIEYVRGQSEGASADADNAVSTANAAHQLAQGVATSLASTFIGPTDPSTFLAPGTEYVWHKTDGAGTLLDIVSGVA